MADESDDTLDERIESLQRRAEGFRELLQDGDEVTIAYQDGEVHVGESYRSKFERMHPKLFGRMLSIQAQMEPGYFPYVAALMLAGVFILGLHLKWWDALLGETVNDLLQNWWFYLVAPCILLYLARLACGRWQKYVYRRCRQGLVDLIAAGNLDRDVLLVTLRDEEELESVVYQMKLDTGPFPPLL